MPRKKLVDFGGDLNRVTLGFMLWLVSVGIALGLCLVEGTAILRMGG